jgi:hypothetical protein
MFAQDRIGRKDRADELLSVLPGSCPRPELRTALSFAASLDERPPLVFAARVEWTGRLLAWTAGLSFCSGLCALAISSAFEVTAPRWAILAYGGACALQALVAPALGRSWRRLQTSRQPGCGFPTSGDATVFGAMSPSVSFAAPGSPRLLVSSSTPRPGTQTPR